jgi:hypothetical protein
MPVTSIVRDESERWILRAGPGRRAPRVRSVSWTIATTVARADSVDMPE